MNIETSPRFPNSTKVSVSDNKARHTHQLLLMWKDLGRNLICKTYLVRKVERVLRGLRFGIVFSKTLKLKSRFCICVLRRMENLAVLGKVNGKRRQNELSELMVAQIFAAIPSDSFQPYCRTTAA